MSLFTRILRVGETKTLKKLERLASQVNQIEPDLADLSDSELTSKTQQFRLRLKSGETVDSLEAEAYAVVREASKRVLGQRHYDVQIVGAGALHRGMIAEMRTGEGKTLVSTMPVYLNSLTNEGVHVVTVNDYLAARDAEWMGGIYRMLGLTVGLIQSSNHDLDDRQAAYQADVTYGTNNEYGFDYLRDNMAVEEHHRVQRGHSYAIVDEVDSILIDEARTPLIISGQVGDTAKWYRQFATITKGLKEDEHYTVDLAKRQVVTTEAGVDKVERMLGISNLYDHAAVDLVHHLDKALRAKTLYKRDVDYLLSSGEVKIVDEFTGRMLEGRRYSDGLHQAIEAKEGVRIKAENQTLATVTLQNYFRLYSKLAGMTGTALTEAAEFSKTYGLEVVEVPTNVPVIRVDQPDVIYQTEETKFSALVLDIEGRHQRGQPVLVGTVSIDKSEQVSRMLNQKGIKHTVLNAKHHNREAEIIAQAGQPGAVTVATNMAGRGVDIQLGGNPEGLAQSDRNGRTLEEITLQVSADRQKVIDTGGLYVLGTERHDSRRIDNQLRGRSGRQGDPGESRFYLSLGDNLMRRFASDRAAAIMNRLRIPDNMPISANMVSKSIERAQSRVEAHNFEIRKNVLKYDAVMNQHREIIYRWRNQIISSGLITRNLVMSWVRETINDTVTSVLHEGTSPADWNWDELLKELHTFYPSVLPFPEVTYEIAVGNVIHMATEEATSFYRTREKMLTAEVMRQMEQGFMLAVIDNKWREHLADMDYLREGIGLRAMGQRDPLAEYQKEGYDMFADLVRAVKRDTVRYLFQAEQVAPASKPQPSPARSGTPGKPVRSKKVGRNAPCPCGSGMKSKRCDKNTVDCVNR